MDVFFSANGSLQKKKTDLKRSKRTFMLAGGLRLSGEKYDCDDVRTDSVSRWSAVGVYIRNFLRTISRESA